MIKLSKFVELISKNDSCFSVISANNVDDIFKTAYEFGIRDIVVNDNEMGIIVQFYLAITEGDKNGNQGEVVKSGKLDKLFGINIHRE